VPSHILAANSFEMLTTGAFITRLAWHSVRKSANPALEFIFSD
jgi:hypothetical protein